MFFKAGMRRGGKGLEKEVTTEEREIDKRDREPSLRFEAAPFTQHPRPHSRSAPRINVSARCARFSSSDRRWLSLRNPAPLPPSTASPSRKLEKESNARKSFRNPLSCFTAFCMCSMGKSERIVFYLYMYNARWWIILFLFYFFFCFFLFINCFLVEIRIQ